MEKKQRAPSKQNGKQKPKTRNRADKDRTVRAPVAMGVIDTHLVQSTRFGQAAPHDDFPEGGLRISGSLPNTAYDGIGVNGTASTFSAFNSSATPGLWVGFGVSPSAFLSFTAWPTGCMFGGNSPVTYISSFFRKWRFRELSLIYEGTSSTTTAGSVQISYEPEAPSATNRILTSTTQTAGASSRAVRFPAWTPRIEVPLIWTRKNPSPGDFLFSGVGTNVGISSTTNGSLSTLFQGAVIGLTDQPTAAAATWGRYRWKFVLDLYGLSNYTGDASLSLSESKLQPTPPRPLLAVSTASEVKEEGEELGADSPVMIKSRRDQAAYADSESKDKTPASLPLGAKAPPSAGSVRGAR